MLFCIFLLLLTEIECFLCMFAGNLREFIYMGISDEKLWESCLKGDKEALPILRIAAQLWNQVTSRQELGGRLRTGYFYQFDSKPYLPLSDGECQRISA